MSPKIAIPVVKKKPMVWVTATGSWTTRVKKARFYLKHRAWLPKNSAERSTALLVVVCNLRRYFGIRESFSSVLIKEHYLPRLASKYPETPLWTEPEIREKYRISGKRGMYPTLGVSDPRALAKVKSIVLRNEVRTFIQQCVATGGSCLSAELRAAFLSFRGGAPVSPIVFGRAVVAVTGIKSTNPFGKRTYRGIQILEADPGLTNELNNRKPAA